MLTEIGLKDIKQQVATLAVAERFFDSAVLFALFELGVFRLLADGPRDLGTLHEEIGGSEETLRAVLDAAAGLELLSKEDGAYGVSDAFLASMGIEDSPAYLGEWIAFLHALATPLLKLDEAVRTGEPPGALFEDMSADNLPAKRMTRAMDAYSRTRGVELATRLDYSGVETLLDIGCGPGTYSLAIIERHPGIRATLVDLPGPIAEARRIMEARGVADRVEFIATDALTHEFTDTYDMVLVSNTLHMLGPELSQKLLDRCYDLVSPGGMLVIQAQYLEDDRTSPRWPVLLNLVQRVATPHGRNHAIGETTEWLRRAGFSQIDYKPFSPWNVNSALVARRDPAP